MEDADIRIEFHNRWTEIELKNILDLLFKVASILDKTETHWCMVSGTLLGSVRHNSIIPWDNDVDVSIFTFENIELINNELKKIELRLEKRNNNRDDYYKIFDKNNLCIDLFHHELIDDKTLRSFGHAINVFTDVPPESWFPYSFGKLNNLILPTPAKPEVYLNTLYTGWNEYGVSRNHNGKKELMTKLRSLNLCN